MRKADRLFDLIQILRTAKGPITAAVLAAELEVTVRTVYRDVAALQASRVPIEGAPGLGYVLRRGFDLPPLMFTADEIEAIAVGTRMLQRTGDAGLMEAAESVLSKITVALPDALRAYLSAPRFYVSARGAPSPRIADLSAIRVAIRNEHKLRIAYSDERGNRTHRTVWPIAIAYCVEATLVSAWCELRNDFRHFRTDRVLSLDVLDEHYPVSGHALMSQWLEKVGGKEETGAVARAG